MTVKLSFVPHLVASVCFGVTLAACVGGDGDDAWRSDDSSSQSDDTSGTQECDLTAAGDGLTLKICDLPEGSTLPILHTSGDTQSTLTIEGSSADAQALSVSAQGGDVLKLETAIVGAPQEYLVQCAFTSYSDNGSLQDDGSLLLKEGFETATQTVRCGRVRLIYTRVAPERQTSISSILRLNLDTAQASWLLDSQGNQMTYDSTSSHTVFSRFAGGKQILYFTDPVSGESGVGTTSGTDGDQQLLNFTAQDGTQTKPNLNAFTDNWSLGKHVTTTAFQYGSNPELLHFSSQAYGSWQTDGTDAGSQFSTVFDSEKEISGYQLSGDKLWYTVRTEAADGTGTLSRHSKDLTTGTVIELIPAASATIGTANILNDKWIYGNYTRSGKLYRLYATDGTDGSTQTLIDQTVTDNNYGALLFTRLGNYFYFKFGKSQLWRTDGTPGGTEMVFDLKTYANYSLAEIANIAATDEFLAFSATIDNQSGIPIRALYRTDGSTSGTTFIIDPATLMPSTDAEHTSHQDFANLFVVGKRIVFYDDAANYTKVTKHLWSTDGTETGTVRLFPNAEVSPTYTAAECQLSCRISNFMVLNDRLYIRAINLLSTDTGDEYRVFFWVSDGTADGTAAISDTDGNRFNYASYD